MAKSIGAALREARARSGLSQSAVAKAAGLAPGQLSQIESGRSASPEFVTVAKIATVIGASLNELAAAAGLQAFGKAEASDGTAILARASEVLRVAATNASRLQAQVQRAHDMLLEELPASRPSRRRKRSQ